MTFHLKIIILFYWTKFEALLCHLENVIFTKNYNRTPYDYDTVDEVSGNPQIFSALVLNREEVGRGDADDGRGEGDGGCNDYE